MGHPARRRRSSERQACGLAGSSAMLLVRPAGSSLTRLARLGSMGRPTGQKIGCGIRMAPRERTGPRAYTGTRSRNASSQGRSGSAADPLMRFWRLRSR